MVAVAFTVLVPAFTEAVMDFDAHVSQLAVGGKDSAAATGDPLTVMSIGRSVVTPLAYRKVRVAVPADRALIVHCTELPTTLLVLTKPAPENPGWLDSTRPCEIVAFSTSYRVGAATAGVAAAARPVASRPTVTSAIVLRRARLGFLARWLTVRSSNS